MATKVGHVIVEVRGGTIVEIYADQPLHVSVIDWDDIIADPTELSFQFPVKLIETQQD